MFAICRTYLPKWWIISSVSVWTWLTALTAQTVDLLATCCEHLNVWLPEPVVVTWAPWIDFACPGFSTQSVWSFFLRAGRCGSALFYLFFKIIVITCKSLRYRWSCVHVHWRACISWRSVQVLTLLWINATTVSLQETTIFAEYARWLQHDYNISIPANKCSIQNKCTDSCE